MVQCVSLKQCQHSLLYGVTLGTFNKLGPFCFGTVFFLVCASLRNLFQIFV
jgi:hypothetical protein